MSSPIIISVKFHEQCKLVPLIEGLSLKELFEVIKGKWPVLNSTPFTCTCSIGDISGCCLDCESDFESVLILCQINSVRIVYVTLNTNVGIEVGCVSGGSGMNFGAGFHEVGSSGVKHCASSGQSFSNEAADLGGSDRIGGNNSKSHKKRKEPFTAEAVINKRVACQAEFGQQAEWGGNDNLPSYDVCPTLKKKPLLSDDWANIMDDGVGLEFRGGAVEFRRELLKYTTKMGFRFRYMRNDSRYIHAVCKEDANEGCEWFIKAKCQNVTKYFEIYKANMIHKCVGKLVNDSSRLSASLMAGLVLQKVKSKPTICGRDIVDFLKDSYGLDITYARAWRTVEAARSMIFGSYDESYDQLRWYCRAILRTNPGSVVSLEQNVETKQFERVFIGFKACIEGFRSCRPMLFIDGTFMKGRAKGTLLSATAKDGNNGLFPVAFAVVSAENKENWIWFLEKLRDFVKHNKQILYISDRNKGLMSAFPIVFKEPVHFYCLYHLLTNLKKAFSTGWSAKYRKDLGIYFKECAYAPNVRIFEEKFEIFKSYGGSIAEKWLIDLPFDKWAVAYSPHITRYGEMTSNAAESFNSWIRRARALPITYMIDSICDGISRWYVKRRSDANTWTSALCVTKQDLWNYLSDIGSTFVISECPNGTYQVHSSPTALVDLRSKKCSCYQWQVRGFPCAHAVAVIRKAGTSIYDHVEDCFFVDNYRACYRHDIHSIPDTERFECPVTEDDDTILPPILNRPAGRPKQGKRINSYGQFRQNKGKYITVCECCGKEGTHDKSTCPQSPGVQVNTSQ